MASAEGARSRRRRPAPSGVRCGEGFFSIFELKKASFGDVLISFEIKMSISEDDDS